MKVIQFIIVTLLLLTACDSADVAVSTDKTAVTTTDNETTSSDTTDNETTDTDSTGSLDKTDEMSKISYAMGANSGTFMVRNLPELEKWGVKIDIELLKAGFLESLNNKSQMEEEEIQAILLAFQETIKTKLAEEAKQKAEEVSAANKQFLTAHTAKDGVKTTESGMLYRMIKTGTGDSPAATDTVKVHYRGTLVNGEEFDSSYTRGKPAQFALNAVISGWTEGLQLVKQGGKIELVLPPELAYGERELPSIPANSILIFEVELLEIIKTAEVKTE